ncbi:endonuclease domain-containing protein [Pararobbsia alpina]|uniref:Uncharacterized protein n=1 Tax=Pararobbsia alpina TaxID=621374 RepID=A0A6S7BFT0_9BURK|nr:endonuclease domain-containing protein [Pararobbsia alpina]CAB3798784.1 hypothetical protein LMG28138_04523 [Pararobbsia alpina]
MPFQKLPKSELAEYRKQQIARQGGRCPISGWILTDDTAAADHCHKTGMHRGTLPGWINACLGRIENAARSVGRDNHIPTFLRKCADYIEWYELNPSFLFHHTYKTPEEKKEAAKKRAAKRRKEKKAAQ